jgi:hypothetical protein
MFFKTCFLNFFNAFNLFQSFLTLFFSATLADTPSTATGSGPCLQALRARHTRPAGRQQLAMNRLRAGWRT